MSFSFPSTKNPVYNNKKLEELYNKISMDPEDYASHLQYAELLLATPNFERSSRAIKSLEKILVKNNANVDALVLHVKSLRWVNRIKESQSMAEYYCNEYSETIGFYIQLIMIYIQQNKFDQAKNFLTKALKKFSDDLELTRAQIYLYSKIQQYDTALTVCNDTFLIFPNDPRIIRSKCVILWNMGNHLESIASLKEFKNNFPEEYNSPLWDTDGDYTSCGVLLSELLLRQAREISDSDEHLFTNVDYDSGKPVFKIKKNLSDKAKKLFENIIDETTELLSNTEFADSQDNVRLIHVESLMELEKFQDADIMLYEITSENHLESKNYLKIRTSLYLERYRECVAYAQNYLKQRPISISAKRILGCAHLMLGNLKDFELIKKELTEENEISSSNEQEPAGFHIYPREHLKNDQNFIDFLCNFSGDLRISNQYTKKDIVEYLERAITNYECKIQKVRILSGPFDLKDGGKQFHKMYKELMKKIALFNKTKSIPCQITVKIKMDYDEHARYYFDRKSVYNGTGTDQVISGDKDDFSLLDDLDAIDDIKKEFRENWIDHSNYELTEANWHNLLRAYGEKSKEPFCESIENELDFDKKQQ